MRFAAGAMHHPEPVDIFGREHETGKRVAWIDQAMERVSQGRIDVENARRVEVSSGFGNWRVKRTCVIISLKEQVLVVHPAPMQQRISAGTCRHRDNMQVVPEPDSRMRALTLQNEFTSIISGIHAQRDHSRLFQGEPDCDRLWLYPPQ